MLTILMGIVAMLIGFGMLSSRSNATVNTGLWILALGFFSIAIAIL